MAAGSRVRWKNRLAHIAYLMRRFQDGQLVFYRCPSNIARFGSSLAPYLSSRGFTIVCECVCMLGMLVADNKKYIINIHTAYITLQYGYEVACRLYI